MTEVAASSSFVSGGGALGHVNRALNLYSYYVMGRTLLRRRSHIEEKMQQNRLLFYSEIWRTAAESIGALLTDLGSGHAEVEKDGARVRIFRNDNLLDPSSVVRLSNNKPLAYALLRKAGVRVPSYVSFGRSSIDAALKFFRSSPASVVVKPAVGTSGGEGVTTNIAGLPDFYKAVAFARAYSRETLIEEFKPGSLFRLLYLDGELLDCVRRDPPSIEGDGRSPISALIADENRSRVGRGTELAQSLIIRDRDMAQTLAESGRNMRTVLPAGERISLKRSINDSGVQETVRVEDGLSPSLTESGATAARVLGLRVAGVDIICSDPTRSLADTGGAIIDVNAAPGLYYHYRNTGECRPVAEPILRAALDANG